MREEEGRAPDLRRRGLLFKGSGFYITDYRSKGYQDGAKADSEASKPKTEAKPEAKPEPKKDPKKPS